MSKGLHEFSSLGLKMNESGSMRLFGDVCFTSIGTMLLVNYPMKPI